MRRAMRGTAIAVLASAAVVLGLAYGAAGRSEAKAQGEAGAKGERDADCAGRDSRADRATDSNVREQDGIQGEGDLWLGGGTHKQVVQGAAFDVPVVQPPYQDVLDSGNVVASSERPLASVAVGVAVRKGAPKPDISTPEALKKTLLAAKSIAYPDASAGAAAGVSVEAMLKNLGIADQIQAKIQRAQGGAGAMAAVAKGTAEIGMTFLSEMEDPGIDVAGPLPNKVCPPTRLVGFVSAHAKSPEGAKELLAFLSSKQAASAYKAQHMTPGK